MKYYIRRCAIFSNFTAQKKKVLLYFAAAGLLMLLLYISPLKLLVDIKQRNSFSFASIVNPHHDISLNHPFGLDIDKYTSQLIAGIEPHVPPINRYDLPYAIPNSEKCVTIDGCRYNIRLLLIVKSTIGNFEKRNAIRQTWGWEKRFPDVVIRCVFNLGLAKDKPSLQQQVEKEQSEHGDIIQGNFTDDYKNNTIKTMMGFRWVVENCSTAKFIMFVDDDMYVSAKNALQYANRPDNFPKYLQVNNSEIIRLNKNNVFQFDLNEPPASFFAGHAKYYDPPFRDKSKWTIALSEYPFPIYPPYVPAGAYILSFNTLRKMYYTSMYTPHFPYDDVYLGMIAKRAGITPIDNENFIFGKRPNDFKFVISVHGFGNTTDLIYTWKKQFQLNYA